MSDLGCRKHGLLEPAELRQQRIFEARHELARALSVPTDEVQIQSILWEQSELLHAVWIPPWRYPELGPAPSALS